MFMPVGRKVSPFGPLVIHGYFGVPCGWEAGCFERVGRPEVSERKKNEGPGAMHRNAGE